MRSNPSAIPVRPVALPKGGGAITGIGESFAADEFTGVAGLTLPLPSASARDFEPNLSLAYSSGAGNGPFGIGFSLSLPFVTRSTQLGLPRYENSDRFVLAGEGELVPRSGGSSVQTAGGVTYRITAFSPRQESAFDLIELWLDASTGDTLWRTIDRGNVTTIYGGTAASRISDPADASHVFTWLLDQRFDAKGNVLSVSYLPENLDAVAPAIYEAGRVQTANKYPDRIRFGNTQPFTPPPFGIGPPPADGYAFETVFDYGQYDVSPANPDPYTPSRTWKARTDPFSSYASGFEIRTHRLCRGVLIFHHFESLAPDPVLAHAVRFVYDEDPAVSRLIRMDSTAYAYDGSQPPAGRYTIAPLPPLELTYVAFEPQVQTFRTIEVGTGAAFVLGESAYSLVDLYGEGAAGILFSDGSVTWYAAPQLPVDGNPSFASFIPLPDFPSPENVSGAALQLMDVDGDGRVDLVVAMQGQAGFYANAGVAGWRPFQPFQEWPGDLLAAGQTFADIDGDGLSELVLITADSILYYPSGGAAGYGTAQTRQNVNGVPPLTRSAPNVLVTFGDVLGCGTPQVIVVSNGVVECWPSLGYGAFAPPVTLGNAPVFGGDFDVSRLRLVDLDGTGAADIAYVTGDSVRIWRNLSGNQFAPPFDIHPPGTLASPSDVAFADVDGSGTTAMVIVNRGGASSYNFSGGRKPYLLAGFSNGLGASTTIEYASSARYYLRDKAAGRGWLTSLPFPVQVVSAVEHRDEISQTVSRLSNVYHDGYFDPFQRSYRGFGMIERWDAERLDGPPAPGVTAPAYTKTWYHTGAYFEGPALQAQYASELFAGDPQAIVVPLPVYVWGSSAVGFRAAQQGAASLAGRAIRVETYGLDGGALAAVPYEISQTNYLVQMLQAPAQWDGIYVVREQEGADSDYERVADDPQITAHFNLLSDEFGNVTLSCSVVYPRRGGKSGTLPQQTVLRVLCERAEYINAGAGIELRILGLPYSHETLELENIPPPASLYFGFDEISAIVSAALAGIGPAKAGLVQWRRIYYCSDSGGEAPLGTTGAQQLVRREEQAYAEGTALSTLFDGILTASELATLLSTNGHLTFDSASGTWWQPGPTGTYAARAGFYNVMEIASAVGGTISYTYDAFSLAALSMTQSGAGLIDRVTTVTKFDYLRLSPLQVTDLNGNVAEVRLDPLGSVFLTSHYGHEGAVAVGFEPILRVAWPVPAGAAEVVADPDTFLASAASYFFYDLLSWTGRLAAADLVPLGVDTPALWDALVSERYINPEGAILAAFRRLGGSDDFVLPVAFAAVRARTYAIIAAIPFRVPASWIEIEAQDYPAAATAPPRIQVDYTDGYGRRVQSKTLTEPGPAIRSYVRDWIAVAEAAAPTPAPQRWITSGPVRYTNKGLPFQELDPYFSDTWQYTDSASLIGVLISTFFTYDALNRLARIDLPAGFLTRYVRTAWQEVEYDPCDSILESPYFAAHFKDGQPFDLDEYAAMALLKTMLCANTPTTRVFDNRRRITAIIDEDNPTLQPSSFVPLGLTDEQAAELFTALQAAGMLDFRGALTIAFQPAKPGFTLPLPPDLQPFAAAILHFLEGLQATGVPLVTRFDHDAQGNEIWAVDPRLLASWPADGEGIKNVQRVFALNNTLLRAVSVDSGTRYELADAEQRAFYQHDGRGITMLSEFDGTGRPSSVAVSGAPAPASSFTALRWVYGDTLIDGQPVVADPKAANLLGAMYRIYDQSGMHQSELYSLTDQPMSDTRFIAVAYALPTDWPPPTLSTSSPLLDPTPYVGSASYDALGRLLTRTDAAGYLHTTTYLLAGTSGSAALTAPSGTTTSFVQSASYDAKLQLLQIGFGNGAHQSYVYDPLTARLAGVQCVGPAGAKLQDFQAWRDACGNLTHLTDNAFAALFGKQTSATPDADYSYDSLYRLTAAEGQEIASRSAARDRDGTYDGLTVPYKPGGIDPGALSSYVRNFAADSAGNLYAILHQSADDNWVSELIVSATSNRAVESSLIGSPPPLGDPPAEPLAPSAAIDAFFDANGNQTAMLGIESVDWTYANQIAKTVTGGVQQFYVYDVSNRRIRTVFPDGTLTDRLDLRLLQLERTGPTVAWRRVRVPFDSIIAGEVIVDESAATTTTFYYLLDPLRGVAFQLDASAALLTYEQYIPFGPTSFAIVADATALERKEKRYSQEDRDRGTGLYDYGARHYAPWSGRWTCPDPSGTVDGLNLYAFAGGNPTTAVDVGGAVKIKLYNGMEIEVTGEELYPQVERASDLTLAHFKAQPLSSTGTEKGLPVYEARARGDLMLIGSHLRGEAASSPATPATSFRLVFGNLKSTLQKAPREPGVHLVTTLKSAAYDARKPDYAALEETTDPRAEASRMIRLMKVKETPTGGSFNNTMIPVMALAEGDRSAVAPHLAMLELYNIRAGERTFDEAFGGLDPHFIGAKKNGGARALKDLTRARLGLKIKSSGPQTRLQKAKLHNSLETAAKVMHANFGKASRFRGLTTKEEVIERFGQVVAKRAGVTGKKRAAAADDDPTIKKAKL